jgi:two-component system torCAD operon response regulator TorR
MQKILLLHPIEETRKAIRSLLEAQSLIVFSPDKVETALEILQVMTMDLMVLDIDFPQANGFMLAHYVRKNLPDSGILLLTQRNQMAERMIGLELGADEVIFSPFDETELWFRARNLLARVGRIQSKSKLQVRHEFAGWLHMPLERKLVNDMGNDVALTSGENSLLSALIKNAQRTASRSYLKEVIARGESVNGQAKRPEEVSERSVDVLIGRLRKKLGDNPYQPKFIKTVPQEGYIFLIDVDNF